MYQRPLIASFVSALMVRFSIVPVIPSRPASAIDGFAFTAPRANKSHHHVRRQETAQTSLLCWQWIRFQSIAYNHTIGGDDGSIVAVTYSPKIWVGKSFSFSFFLPFFFFFLLLIMDPGSMIL
ncbi:uncharacterized protein BDW70DRAFT_107711 [Aspergillus foveolatus]|uniref:uncharacterized protein n=1 Tax=Aspergillus foveolatus TaxID=210207 RepID=UPI003CCD5308